ncbi:MAG: DnaB-like helicase C-terminal domain-containing protein, partial [Methylophilaceae bacterium]
MERLELTILKNLIFNEDYARKVIPFIQPEYYEQRVEKIVFEEIVKFIVKYGSSITIEALNIEIDNRRDLSESENKEIIELLSKLNDIPVDAKWILDVTEKWCRDRAIYLALMESIHIADGNDEKKGRDAIPSILSDALAVSFDNNIGHDYLVDYEGRYDYYHKKENRLEFDLDFFNKITNGGVPSKTLNIFLAGTNVGKTLAMCHMASSFLLQSKNVLYITMEMAEEEIAKRMDANMLNVAINQLEDLPKSIFTNKASKLAEKTKGTLIIKEYPTASAHSGHFKALLNELALKKSFRPDVIFVDYINICASSRFRAGSNINSYSIIKSIAEELRGLAVEHDVPIFSATQTTRSGFSSSDVEITDTSESWGLPATADFLVALISTEELEG